MDRVTNSDDTAGRVLDLLRGAYLTGAEAQRIRCAVAEAEKRGAVRQMDADRAAVERVRAKLAAFRDRAAEGAAPPRVRWSDDLEAEAVAQGQDGPDPEYVVAPRFGGVEMRPVPADRPEGAPDAPAPVRVLLTPGEPGEGGWTVSSPDLPGLNTEGGTVGEALAMAADAWRQLARARDALAPVYAVQAEQAAMTPDDDDADDDDPDSTPLVPFTDEQEGD